MGEWEANELLLFVENDGTLYETMTRPYQKKLVVRKKNGTYSKLQAHRGFMHIARAGTQKYRSDIDARQRFSIADMRKVADRMLEFFEDEYSLGNMN